MDKEVLNPTDIPDHWDTIDSNADIHDTSSDLQEYTANTETVWWLNEIYAELQTLENEVAPNTIWVELADIWNEVKSREKMIASSWDKKPTVGASVFTNNLANPDIQESFAAAAANWRKELASRVWSMQDKAGVPARLQV